MISCSRENLSIQSNVFRSNSSSKSIYKNSSCLSSSTKYQASGLSRRLVNSKFISRKATLGSRESAQFAVTLRFIFNKIKSQLTPRQKIVYLGSLFRLDQGLVFPTLEIIQNIELAVQTLILAGNQMSSAQIFLRVFGLKASCLELIPYVRLLMRPIQLHLLHFWKPSSRDLEYLIPITPHLVEHLKWWLKRANTSIMGSDNHSHNRCFEHGFRGGGGGVHREKLFFR